MRVKQASKIILIGITILALIFLVFLGLRKTQQKKLFAEIQTKYNNNNFDEALHLATQLSEPYKKYYTEFINKRKELDNWSGTDEELFQWLENYLLSADVNEDYFLPDGCQDYLIWGDIVSAERKFEEDSDSLSDAFQWYSDAYLIYKKFECEYMDLCVKNTQLFQNEYGTTVINISREEVNVYDQEMDTLYNNTMKAVNERL